MIDFKFHFENHGFAQIHFKKRYNNKTFKYCAQQMGKRFRFLTCSKENEPSYEMEIDWNRVQKVENPLSETAVTFNKFLNNKQAEKA